MKKFLMRIGLMSLLVAGFLFAWPTSSSADSVRQSDDLVARGEYLTTVAGCVGCHTPWKAEFNDFENLTTDQIRTFALFERNASDTTRLFAGGRLFDLGPAGVIFSRNLTPDEETGLGSWSDDEIKAAIRTGARPDGRQLFPLMPYYGYNQLAESDVDAIVAYLRTLPAVANAVPDPPPGLTDGLPTLPASEGIVAPEPEDTAARGTYLVTALLGCSDCHTPLDPATGQPVLEMYLAGGQPFEGPWGIVYGGNITPHPESGLGDWTAEDLERVLKSGVRNDGRRLALMPWQFYNELTQADMDAVVYYLQNDLPSVDNEVPAAALVPELQEIVELDVADEGDSGSNTTLILVVAALVLVVVAVVVVVMMRRGQSTT